MEHPQRARYFTGDLSRALFLMDIALIMHELLVEGGGERQCVSLARALALRGHQITVYTSAYDRANCFPEICKDLTIIDVGRGRLPGLRKPRFLRGYLDMKRLASAVKSRHEIWNPHHWPAQWGAVWLKRKLGGAVVWMCNDIPNFHEKAQQRRSIGLISAAVHWLYYVYDRAQNRKVDLTLFLSNWAEGEFKAIYAGQTRVVRSGADPDRFARGGNRQKIRDRFGYSSSDFVLLWLGIFMPHRRLQDAIEAVSRLKSQGFPVKLLLAGSGLSFPEYFNNLKALSAQLGVTHEITFAGKVPDEEIQAFYCACDAFLFPNENQTWGLAVLEAMACGCPVLVSSGAAVHEVLADGENAFLFPPRNPATLAARIQEIATQPELRAAIAQKGMDLVRTQFTWDQFARQIEQVCTELAR
ncbi:MAG TPA: glycosyltransferase family 4 protein [Candidatus Dormibacteraeota bacterium]|nr:glycosyltransferase family 4 protein [Candidatus Dormibacteraeota bacterium]